MTLRRESLVFIAVATISFFVSATVFQAMSIVLFAMVGEFHRSAGAEGAAYMSLGLICAASGRLPVAMIPRIGARWTIVCGSFVLALGFFLAYRTSALPVFYLAAGPFGLAFSLVANTSGIYLIASWFGDQSPRLLGVYLMSGTLGGAVGPPVAEALISSSGGWRPHWLAMTNVALLLLLAAMCAILPESRHRRPPRLPISPSLRIGAVARRCSHRNSSLSPLPWWRPRPV
ncbi:MAG: transporter [Rhodospirillales bacterium]|nr:transporter [Rhodospirillales bacterium]